MNKQRMNYYLYADTILIRAGFVPILNNLLPSGVYYPIEQYFLLISEPAIKAFRNGPVNQILNDYIAF